MKYATIYFPDSVAADESSALQALAELSELTVSNYLRMLVRHDIAARKLAKYEHLFQPTMRGGVNNPEGLGGHSGKKRATARRKRKEHNDSNSTDA